mgnify:CR=1 FL=1
MIYKNLILSYSLYLHPEQCVETHPRRVYSFSFVPLEDVRPLAYARGRHPLEFQQYYRRLHEGKVSMISCLTWRAITDKGKKIQTSCNRCADDLFHEVSFSSRAFSEPSLTLSIDCESGRTVHALSH